MKKCYTTEIAHMDGHVYGLYFPVPKELAIQYKELGISRLLVTIEDRKTIHSGLQSRGNDRYFILASKPLLKELELALGDEIEICLRPDKSRYGMEMPKELAAALATDPAGDAHFHALTPGKQRSLIHIVSSAKRGDTRIQRSIGILYHLSQHAGRIDYKELQKDIRRPDLNP